MTDESVIVLAREKPFHLGPVEVRPANRELVRDGRGRETLEPRVMQALVALSLAGGEIVTRDDLTASCWEGRIVGEDAINRVISRLRRAAEGIGAGAFAIETVTKVGYRLTSGDGDALEAAPTASRGGRGSLQRRYLLGAGAAGLAALGAGWWWWRGDPGGGVDPETGKLYDQAWVAIHASSQDQYAQAIGLLRQVVESAPGFADGWGSLAYAYVLGALTGPPATRTAGQARARAAAERALQLDPDNALAQAALVELKPVFGAWRETEMAYRGALVRHPDTPQLLVGLGYVLFSTGQMRAAARNIDQIAKVTPASPKLLYQQTMVYWSANRLEDAQRAADQGMATYPRHILVWFTNFLFRLYSGRPEEAIAMVENRAGRPVGVPQQDFEIALANARAIASRAPADIERALALGLEAAQQGAGYTENAIQAASALGRPDRAFQLIDAYFFGRGFRPGWRSFSEEQGAYYAERRTFFLFFPSTTPLRADPRFGPLVREVGLADYWAKSGKRPDYQLKRG